MGSWKRVYFLDDDSVGRELLGFQIKDKIENVSDYRRDENQFIVGIGNNGTRHKIQRELEEKGFNIATIVHPFTSIGKRVTIGQGTVVLAGVVINPLVSVGRGCILNTACSIDHESTLREYVHLSPGTRLAGNVYLGENTWLGANATIINNIQIEKNIIVGANSLVINDITEEGTYVGSPVRKLLK